MFSKPQDRQRVKVKRQRGGPLRRCGRSVLRIFKSQALFSVIECDLQWPTHGEQFEDGLRRKAKAERDFRFFCEQYFPQTFHLPWSPDHLKVIAKIEQAVLEGGLFAMAGPRRGCGPCGLRS